MSNVIGINHYFNHSPAFMHRRDVCTLLYKEYGVVARFSDSTEYLEAVLKMADDDRAAALAHAEAENAALFEEQVGESVELTVEEIEEVVAIVAERVPAIGIAVNAINEAEYERKQRRAEMRAEMAAMMDELDPIDGR